jgi:hypothetical protein
MPVLRSTGAHYLVLAKSLNANPSNRTIGRI